MVKLHKIYTKTGDDGTTGVMGPHRLKKDHPRIEAIGEVDEANSAIGLARLEAGTEADKALSRIQNDLFDLGADLAQPEKADVEREAGTLRISESQVSWLEQEIDRMNEALAPLTSFILPGGSRLAAHLHLARAITRRAERRVITLSEESPVNSQARLYLNRLSDYLFVVCRYENNKGQNDVLWVPGENR